MLYFICRKRREYPIRKIIVRTRLLSYAYLLYARFKVLTARFNHYNIFAFFSVMLFEMYCFVDCGEFLMIIIFINVIVLITERINEQPTPKRLNALKVFNNRF